MKNLFALLLVLGFSSISFASEDLVNTDGSICLDRGIGKTETSSSTNSETKDAKSKAAKN